MNYTKNFSKKNILCNDCSRVKQIFDTNWKVREKMGEILGNENSQQILQKREQTTHFLFLMFQAMHSNKNYVFKMFANFIKKNLEGKDSK